MGIILTAEFSEAVRTALDQQIPDYLTHTRLSDLINNTVSFFLLPLPLSLILNWNLYSVIK